MSGAHPLFLTFLQRISGIVRVFVEIGKYFSFVDTKSEFSFCDNSYLLDFGKFSTPIFEMSVKMSAKKSAFSCV